jgi:phosphoribosylanthranilate isomerase
MKPTSDAGDDARGAGAGRAPGALAPVRVKLCGTARAEDLALACELRVEYVGFVFWEGSPRRATPDAVGAWRRALGIAAPPRAGGDVLPRFVGVFVNASLDDMARARDAAGLDLLQLHGDETPDACAAASRIAPVIKAVRLGAQAAAAPATLDALDACAALLVEAAHPPLRGGTGRSLDLEIARRAAAGRRVFLAGGLRPDTVADAVRAVRPYAVDVASGVEAAPGRRDRAKAEAFVVAARGAVA